MAHDPSTAEKASRTVGLIALPSEQCPDFSVVDSITLGHRLNARETAPVKRKNTKIW